MASISEEQVSGAFVPAAERLRGTITVD